MSGKIADKYRAAWMAARTTHGAYSGGKESAEHAIWRGMIARCHNPNAKDFYRYGALGIFVCDAWRQSYAVFLDDMGVRPSVNHSVERQDNTKGYTAANCAWATPTEQSRNMSTNRWFTHAGRTQILSDWATELGSSKQLLRYRWKHWGTFERGKIWLLQNQK